MVNKSEDELKEMLSASWGQVFTIENEALKKVVAAVELLRRRVGDLTESSRRLEGLTKWLVGLTIVLAFLTVVLAAPEFERVVAWVKAH
jgi:hypothetical protein